MAERMRGVSLLAIVNSLVVLFLSERSGCRREGGRASKVVGSGSCQNVAVVASIAIRVGAACKINVDDWCV